MKAHDYLALNPVFTYSDFVGNRVKAGKSKRTAINQLVQYSKSGKINRIKDGLYAVVPSGVDSTLATVNPYLLATRMAEDAVVAFHAALQFHGKVYSVWNTYHYLVKRQRRKFSFRGLDFVPVLASREVRESKDYGGGVKELRHADGVVRVTTLERTLVDVFNLPGPGGDWEEIWRSLEMAEYFDVDAIQEFTERLCSSVAVARIGYYLDEHQKGLMLTDQHLSWFEKHRPKSPCYFDNTKKTGKLVRRWNLIVPDQILNKYWEEPLDNDKA